MISKGGICVRNCVVDPGHSSYDERDAETREDPRKINRGKVGRLAGCFIFPGYFPIVGGSTPVCSKMDERFRTRRAVGGKKNAMIFAS